MGERRLDGIGASPGLAAGQVRMLDAPPSARPAASPAEEERRALEALTAAAEELTRLADRLVGDDADMVATAAMIAADPTLAVDVARRTASGTTAEAALVAASEAQAEVIAALPDPYLAQRAADVVSVGRRAARIAAGAEDAAAQDDDVVLVAGDLGPADVADLGAEVRAVALARGGVSAHAAIVARSLGLPMVVGAGEALLSLATGTLLVVDGGEGTVVADPAPELHARARAAGERHVRDRARWIEARDLEAITTGGRRVRVLANVASAAEVEIALSYGADGAGLVRTELAFLDAAGWPTAEQHRRALAPVLHALRGRTATVRVLDFGGDKTPPFLRGTADRGLRLLLSAPQALRDQLHAILDAGRGCDLRVLLPMVENVAELAMARTLLEEAAAVAGVAPPPLGAMIETPLAAVASSELAPRADFLSIGTNDLTHATLGTDRYAPGEARADHPDVVALVARSVRAAHAAGRPIEVCGEAASDPACLPLLVELGVDELSVGAARVGAVREAIRALPQAREAAGQGVERGPGVAPVGT